MPLAVGRGELHSSFIFVHWAVHWCAPGFQGLGRESTGITLLLGIHSAALGGGKEMTQAVGGCVASRQAMALGMGTLCSTA